MRSIFRELLSHILEHVCNLAFHRDRLGGSRVCTWSNKYKTVLARARLRYSQWNGHSPRIPERIIVKKEDMSANIRYPVKKLDAKLGLTDR